MRPVVDCILVQRCTSIANQNSQLHLIRLFVHCEY